LEMNALIALIGSEEGERRGRQVDQCAGQVHDPHKRKKRAWVEAVQLGENKTANHLWSSWWMRY
jgi:hypothetical protein